MDTEIRDFTWAQRDMDTKIHDLGGKRTSTPWTSTPPRTSTRHGQVQPYGQVPPMDKYPTDKYPQGMYPQWTRTPRLVPHGQVTPPKKPKKKPKQTKNKKQKKT